MPKVKQFDKEKVLEVASHIFQTKGYNGTSIDDILVATGLSRSSLYDSFSDKHTLYLQTLEFYKNQRKDALQILDKTDKNGFEKIEIVFNAILNQLITNPNDNGCLMVNAAAEMSKQCFKTNHVVCNSKEDMQKLLVTWLQDAVNEKAITLSNPVKNYAPFLYNAMLGMRVMSQSGASKSELQNIVKVTLNSLH
jgi:TetR/AcrR family transcriptional regulator, transcriptional repressor for nem operon